MTGHAFERPTRTCSTLVGLTVMTVFIAVVVSLLIQAPAAVPQTAPPSPPQPAPGNPVVLISTSQGDITVELFKDRAPVSVANFLEYVSDGFYAETIFHRVIPSFMIQGGGFTPGMVEKGTRPPILNEATNGLNNVRGTVAMARTQALRSATSQFYINVSDNRRQTRSSRLFARRLRLRGVRAGAHRDGRGGPHRRMHQTTPSARTATCRLRRSSSRREAGFPGIAPAPASSRYTSPLSCSTTARTVSGSLRSTPAFFNCSIG